MKNIFDYKDYRLYIKDIIQDLRDKDPKLTYRALSKKLGFTSSNFPILIIQGKRNLGEKSIESLSRFLKHTRAEGVYFKNLVQFNQTTDLDKKLEYSKKLLESSVSAGNYKLSTEIMSYYSNSLNIILRELVWLKDFKETYDWISSRLISVPDPKEVKKAIETLVSLNLLERDKDGKLVATHDSVSTPDDKKIEMFRSFHIDMITRAINSYNETELPLRNITSVTIPIKLDQLPALEKKITDFRASVIKAISDSPDPDEVYQLNIQLFPLTKS